MLRADVVRRLAELELQVRELREAIEADEPVQDGAVDHELEQRAALRAARMKAARRDGGS